jgi:sulfatase modifying factor 1
MVNVGPFCIDSTEVTEGQYLAFLNDPNVSVTDPSLQPTDVCGWNNTFVPNDLDSECSVMSVAFAPEMHPNYPVHCINWCDAYAFCRWAGKHLCGNVDGGTAGTINEWLYACSRNGDRLYPYGAAYMPTVCNGADYGAGIVLDVGQLTGCVETWDGGGVYDLSGNVREWEDVECESAGGNGQDDGCPTGGGDYASDSADLECNMPGNDPRYYCEPLRGFRCCSP